MKHGVVKSVFLKAISSGVKAPEGLIDRYIELTHLKELLEILACPACQGDMQEQENEVVCQNCGLKYPIRDGIPVMLVDEAKKQGDLDE